MVSKIYFEYILLLLIFNFSSCWGEELCKDESEPANSKRHDLASKSESDVVGKESLIEAKQDTARHWEYAEELEDSDYNVRIIDRSLDERAANLIRTISMTRFLDMNYARLSTDNQEIIEEYKLFSGGQEVNEELCTRHLAEMVVLLNDLKAINKGIRSNQSNGTQITLEEKHIRLGRVLDSFGRYKSGMLDGDNRAFGLPEVCLETQLQLDPRDLTIRTGTRICLATLSIEKYLSPNLKTESIGGSTKYSNIDIGICLPNTCHSFSFQRNKHLIQELVNSQFTMPQSLYFDGHRHVESLFCLNDNNLTNWGLPFSGKLFLAVILLWTFLLVTLTYYSHTIYGRANPNLIRLTQCIDIKRTYEDFISDDNRSKDCRVDLAVLNGVKCLSTMIVVLGHALLLQLSTASDLLRAYRAVTISKVIPLALPSLYLVDTFYTISCLLVTYFVIKRLSKSAKQSKTGSATKKSESSLLNTLLFITSSRYLRLVPLYFVIFWFKKSIFLYIGSGINWDHGFNRNTLFGGCKEESWLSPFTLMAAYRPLNKQCLPQAWSIACEIFFAFLIAPLIIMITRKKRLTFIIMGMVGSWSLISALNAFSEPELVNSPPTDRLKVYSAIANLFANQSYLFTASHFRITSAFIGLISGYVLFLFDEGSIKQWPTWIKKRATVFASTNIVTLLICSFYIEEFTKMSISLAFLHKFIVFYRVVWSFSNAILFLRMTTDWKDNFFMRIGNKQFTKSLSKLNFAILLVHMEIIYSIMYSWWELPRFSIFNTVTTFLVTYFCSLVLALFLYISVESPIDKLISSYLFKKNKRDVLSMYENKGENSRD